MNGTFARCTGGQSYCVGLWIGHRYKEPVLQAVHALWSLGATVGPFIIGSFLVELPPKNMAEDVINQTSEKSEISHAAGINHITGTITFNRFAAAFVM